jgi:signal transduction histidine kinase
MKSLRAKLAVGLSLVLLVLLVAGGAALYESTREALMREFDAALQARANALIATVDYDDGNLTLDAEDIAGSDYEGGRHPSYFQIALADGTIVARSPSLKGAALPSRFADEHRLRYRNLTLPDGTPARALAVRFSPRSSEDADSTTPQPLLVVARDLTGLNRQLQFLATELWVIGGLIMGCGVSFTIVIVRRLLAPVSKLAEQTAAIHAGALHSRVSTAGLPAELAPVAERLNELLSRLEQSFERERRFTADAAHELRTPIAELRSLAEVALKWPEGNETTTQAFRDALEIAQRMETIATGLLTLARCEAGKQPVNRQPVAVREWIEELWRPLADRAARRQLRVTFDLAPDLLLQTDRALFGLILTNLFSNAVEYTPVAGTVRVATEQRDGQFELSVTNTEDNLDANDLPHLCERFWRKDAARSSAEHAGLGLALARAFAELLGWQLRADLLEPGTLALSLTGATGRQPQ